MLLIQYRKYENCRTVIHKIKDSIKTQMQFAIFRKFHLSGHGLYDLMKSLTLSFLNMYNTLINFVYKADLCILKHKKVVFFRLL